MKYINWFDTQEEYNSYMEEHIMPNVAVVGDTPMTVHYNAAYDYYKNQYFTTTALGQGTIYFYIPETIDEYALEYVAYSTDMGQTWNTYENGSDSLEISVDVDEGDEILWKGQGYALGFFASSETDALAGSCNIYIEGEGGMNVSGNIMSLLYWDDFKDGDNSWVEERAFFGLFYDSIIISAENLILPATQLADECYEYLFYNAQSLELPPAILPAKILAEKCYLGMFKGCSSLMRAPKLPATILAESCYYQMFYNCTSLTTAPELPATTLTDSCYQVMFTGCTNLTTAPELPATTLTNNCYQGMFYGCSSLLQAPELPATTLKDNCYAYMFEGCTNITRAPELPATTLVTGCYNRMFYNCSSLNYIKALFTTTPASGYTGNWVYGVASTGTFIKRGSWTVVGADGIPSGWTALVQ